MRPSIGTAIARTFIIAFVRPLVKGNLLYFNAQKTRPGCRNMYKNIPRGFCSNPNAENTILLDSERTLSAHNVTLTEDPRK